MEIIIKRIAAEINRDQ